MILKYLIKYSTRSFITDLSKSLHCYCRNRRLLALFTWHDRNSGNTRGGGWENFDTTKANSTSSAVYRSMHSISVILLLSSSGLFSVFFMSSQFNTRVSECLNEATCKHGEVLQCCN